MGVSYPSALPQAGLNGASGGPILTIISDEKELGQPEIRQRSNMVSQVISVEFPPIDQANYDIFINWFENDLFDGILPFDFNDPMSKDIHTYKFVKSTPAFVETRISPNFIKISFQLIRLKVIISEPDRVLFDYFFSDVSASSSSSSFACKGPYEIADQDFTITHLRFWPRNQAGNTGEIVVAIVDASEEIIEILARKSYSATIVNTWNEVQLDTPINILSGQRFVNLVIRTDGSNSSSPGVAFTPAINHDSPVATFQRSFRRADNDVQIGDNNASPGVNPWIVDYKGTVPE
jgi:hypothetical protein